MCSVISNSLQPQAPLSIEFSKQEYWSGLPFPPPGYLPDPGIEPESLESPASAGGLFTSEPPGSQFAKTAQMMTHSAAMPGGEVRTTNSCKVPPTVSCAG